MHLPAVGIWALLALLIPTHCAGDEPAPRADRQLIEDAAGGVPAAPILNTQTRRFDPAPPSVRTRHSVRLAGGDKHLIVEGTLNNSLSGPLLVDTGASYCVITRQSARRLGLEPTGRQTLSIATANGDVRAHRVRLSSVKIADARLAHVDALIMDAVEPPLIGILGLSFLNHFRYSVDPTTGTIQLER